MSFATFFEKLTLAKRSKPRVDLAVDLINEYHLKFIRSIAPEEIEASISKIRHDVSGLVAASQTLLENGVVVVRGAVSSAQANEALCQLGELVQPTPTKSLVSMSYREKSESKKPMFDYRTGVDDGMLDVFNIDLCGLKSILDLRLQLERISESVLGCRRNGVSARNLNYYQNHGVKKTRGFHVDNYTKKWKVFLYLTDVLSLDDGPYTYVKKSHSNCGLKEANHWVTKDGDMSPYETPVVDQGQILPVIGEQGTVIISDQTGAHRGFPQSPAHSRSVLTLNLE